MVEGRYTEGGEGGGGRRRRRSGGERVRIMNLRKTLCTVVILVILGVGARGVGLPEPHPPPEPPVVQALTIGTRFRPPDPTPDETGSRSDVREGLNVGIIMPMTKFKLRKYQGQVRTGLRVFDKKLGSKYRFGYSEFIQQQLPINPSPTKILDTLCDKFLPMNVSAIIYTTKDERFGRNTASSQYFLQLAGYLGIPVIAWNADNSGLEQASMSGLRIQMAPSIHHQAAAMLSILVRYQWHAFTIVTSHIAGHSDFVQTVRDQVHQYRDTQDLSKPNIKFTIIDTVLLNQAEKDLAVVVDSEARIMLLYSTNEEAKHIMRSAEKLSLTGKNYVWIVTQSVVGPSEFAPSDFPVGMLGECPSAVGGVLVSAGEFAAWFGED
uniref:Receptor ligand binding region domain-containing protein n=1 Tax=Scylla olivacea TaxID=85551 RepID=A0A0P4WC48_SCYOL